MTKIKAGSPAGPHRFISGAGSQRTRVTVDIRPSPKKQSEMRQYWSMLTAFGRFEQVVAFALGLIIAAVILIALAQLVMKLAPLLIGGALDPQDHEVFQSLFGMIMTLLIAMEFRHSIVRVALRRDSIIQVKTVLLIALLALSRKFIVLDVHTTSSPTIAALAGATLALGIVYWLLRERDDRLAMSLGTSEVPPPGPPRD